MENNEMRWNDEIEVNLGELFRALFDRLSSIILCTLIGALAFFLAVQLFVTPTYTSTTKLYVLSKTADTSAMTSTELQAGSLLSSDYVELVQSREVTETVIARLGLKNADGKYMTHEQLADMISVSALSDTRVISITIKDKDPYRAHDIAEEVRLVAAGHIKDVMDFESVNVVEKANTPTRPSSPNNKRAALIGGLLGFLLSAIYILVRFLMDDTIKTEEDVQRYLGVSTLGLIPLQAGESRETRSEVRSNRRAAKKAARRVKKA